jgi:hypothetical protein
MGAAATTLWIGHGPSSFPLSSAGFERVEFQSLALEKLDAVDNFRNFSGVMVPRLVTSYTMGGFIHILLVLAIIVVLIRVMQGRKAIT